MIDQRERHFASAILSKPVEHTLSSQGVPFRIEVPLCHRRPGRVVIKSAGSGTIVGWREQHFDRRHLASEASKMVADFRQGVAVGGLEYRQQGLTDDPALVTHAVQQQLLAVVIRRAELEIKKDWNENEDNSEGYCLPRQRPRPAEAARRVTPALSSGIRSRRSFRCGRNLDRHRGISCEYA